MKNLAQIHRSRYTLSFEIMEAQLELIFIRGEWYMLIHVELQGS